MKEKSQTERKNRSYVLFLILTLIICIVLSLFIGNVLRGINIARYKTAEKSFLNKDYEIAIEQFEKLGYYKDSYERKNEAKKRLIFNQAQELSKANKYEEAIEKFEEIIYLSNTEDEIKYDCENEVIKLRYNMAEKMYNDISDKENIEDYENTIEKYKNVIEKYENIVELYGHSHNKLIIEAENKIKELKYLLAKIYYNNGQDRIADTLFKEIEGYNDSDAYIARIATANDEKDKETVYEKAITLMENGEYEEAIMWFTDIKGYSKSENKIEECKKLLKMQNLNHVITTGVNNSFAIDKNYNVKDVGKNTEQQRDVNNDNWKNIISLDCYGSLTIGLTANNKVVITGSYDNDKKVNMDYLENIIDVTAGEQFVAALDEDGQVYADGLIAHNWDLSEWNDVIDIDAGWDFLVGLTENHELRFIGVNAEFFENKYVEADWKNVICISAGGGGNHEKGRDEGHGHIVGLKKDGNIIAIGDDNHEQCSEAINNWNEVVRISAGDWYTVGLTETGGVLITGENFDGSHYIDNSLGKKGLQNLENIVEVAAGFGQTLCLQSDGSIYSFGFDDIYSPNELYKTRDWHDLLLPK